MDNAIPVTPQNSNLQQIMQGFFIGVMNKFEILDQKVIDNDVGFTTFLANLQ